MIPARLLAAIAAALAAANFGGIRAPKATTSRRQQSPVLALAFTMVFGTAHAQNTDLRLPINVDADSLDYDGKNSMLVYRGLRLSQGSMGIQADEGRANKLDSFEDSDLQLAGNVIIDVENGHIESDAANLKFSRNELVYATITGSPATFRMQRPGNDLATYAEAGNVKYDFRAGTVEFSDEAVIVEGCNQISSNYLVYNIKEQRINAQSAGDGEEKVKITYTPRDSVNSGTCDNNAPKVVNPQDDARE